MAVFGWIIFRAENISQIGSYLYDIFDVSLFSVPKHAGIHALFVNILLLVFVEWVTRNKKHGLDIEGLPFYIRYFVYLLFAFIMIAFGGQTTNFIYFQF